MMLGNAFSVHTRGRDWRRELEIQECDAVDDDDGDVSTTRRRKIANLADIFRRQGSEIIATKRGSDSQADIVRWFADDDALAPYGIHNVWIPWSPWKPSLQEVTLTRSWTYLSLNWQIPWPQ